MSAARAALLALAALLAVAALQLVERPAPPRQPPRPRAGATGQTPQRPAQPQPTSAGAAEAARQDDAEPLRPVAVRGARERAPLATARAFLAAYLRYSYAHARRPAFAGTATATLRARLASAPPSVPTAVRQRQPRLRSLLVERAERGRAIIAARIDDGLQRYSLSLELRRARRGRWQVASLHP